MSIITCKGDGVYLFRDDNEFEVHLEVESDIKDEIGNDELRRRINNALLAHDTCARTCAFWYGGEIHFKPSNFTPWKESEANLICKIVQAQNAQLSEELRFKKRIRQVRDALNKCKDAQKIKQIAGILGV